MKFTDKLTLGLPGEGKYLPKIFWFLITVCVLITLGYFAWNGSNAVVDDVISSEPAAIIVDTVGSIAGSISESVGDIAASVSESVGSVADSAKDMVGFGPDTIEGEPIPIEIVEPVEAEPVETDVPPTE